MHPSQFYAPKEFAYVPLIMSVILSILTGYLFFIKSQFRTLSRGFAYLSASVDLFSTVIHFFIYTTSFTSVIMYGLSCSSAFASIWCVFYYLFKQKSSLITRFLLYFGWFWAFVTVVLGVVIALKGMDYSQRSPRKGEPLFLYEICNWIFILTVWVAILFVYRRKTRIYKTMIAYAIFNTASATFFTIYTYSIAAQKISEFAVYFLGNATAYISTAIISSCCLDWMSEKNDDIELVNIRPADIETDSDSQITLTEAWMQRIR